MHYKLTSTNQSIGLTIFRNHEGNFVGRKWRGPAWNNIERNWLLVFENWILIFLRSLISGSHSEGDPPVPIPNTVVKPLSADGTACLCMWKSRTLPDLIWERPVQKCTGLFFPNIAQNQPPKNHQKPQKPDEAKWRKKCSKMLQNVFAVDNYKM